MSVQLANGPSSTRHSKRSPAAALNSKVGAGSATWPAGPPVIVVLGGSVSTVKVREAGVASLLPARSVDRTSSVCSPSASRSVVNGASQAA